VSVTLKNEQIELQIDLPNENYKATRFDQTGKIISLKYNNLLLSGSESLDSEKDEFLGKGFYNEFGIDKPFNFDDTPKNEWFHKIGVGSLKKTEDNYFFHQLYEKRPLDYKIDKTEADIIIQCTAPNLNGYSYRLTKKITLLNNGFSINYLLENIGDKDIITTEYVHNFLAFNSEAIGPNYILKFPFELHIALFNDTLNSENKVVFEHSDIKFNETPNKDYFFSNLSGNKYIKAQWELINLKHKIGIRETGDFKTNKINLWGVKHVICPELFYHINLKPNTSQAWSRTYSMFEIW
jgi:hypothetical protein